MKPVFFALSLCTLFCVIGCGVIDALILRPSPVIRRTPEDFGFQFDAKTLPMSDEVQISIWHARTAQPRKGIIVVVPGNDANKSRYTAALPVFGNDGWDLILMDYEGYGESGGTASLQGLIDSTRVVFDYALSQADVVVGLGISMGSPVLARIAADTDLAACIFESTLNVWEEPTLFLDHHNLGSPLAPLANGLAAIGTPDAYDTKRWMALITEPKLFFHSPEDNVTPFQGAWELYQIAPAPKQLITTQGEHGTAVFLDPALYRSIANGWLNGVLTDDPDLDQQYHDLLEGEVQAALEGFGL